MEADSDQPSPADAHELFEHAPCGYLCVMPEGGIAQVNETFLEMTGFSREEVAGTKFRELLTAPGRIYYETHLGPLLHMQGVVKAVAFDLIRAGAREPLPVLLNAKQKRAADGGVMHTWMTLFDATDRRQYERELLIARRRAEEAVGKERGARELAEQAGRSKDEFLALISHELRTPLNAILGWVQILRGPRLEAGDLTEGLETIERNARVQSQLVGDLLDMGRITSGKMRLEVQKVDLALVVSQAMETARPAAEAKGIRLQKILDPTVIVSGDPGRLQQIFWNLLSNAMKFTPREGFVRVVMERVNSHVEVRVVDSGQGMKAEFVAHAFEKYSQSDTTANRKIGGLGLGLSIVRHLVEMHGGSVRAASEGVGLGSTFTVILPVMALHAADENGVHPRPAITNDAVDIGAVTLSGVRVLVVDDEREARETIRRLLVQFHAEVLTAESVSKALQVMEGFRPQVLVSDIGLPGEDGYELVRRVRMLGGGLGNIPALALTAFSRLEDRTRAMLAGYQMHLTKPVEPTELVVTVANLAGLILR